MKQTRQLSLDGLRGIAALAVVIYHYLYRIEELYPTGYKGMDWTYFGHFGVHLFFMISGYVIFMSINKDTKPISFLISRFTRLYPAYLFAVIITFTIVSIFGLEGREVTIHEFLLNFLMFQEYLGIPHVDGVYWTLTVEITFYFWCFLLIFFKKVDYLILMLFTFACFFLASPMMPEMIYKIIGKFLFVKYVSFFLLGVVTYKLKSEVINYKNISQIVLVFILLFLSHDLDELAVYLVIYILFLLGVFDLIKTLKFSFFIFMGEISYSLYLVHQNIGYIIITRMMDAGFTKIHAVIGALIASIFLAKLMFTYVEAKLGKQLKLYLNRKLKEVKL